MHNEVEVQIHWWPWSVGAPEETTNLLEGECEFPFYGSPVVSVSVQTALFLSRRHEKFVQFGPTFKTLAGEYQLHETPHGVIAMKDGARSTNETTLSIFSQNSREEVILKSIGAVTQYYRDEKNKYIDSTLYNSVLSWSQFFDNCYESPKIHGGKLPWATILEIFSELAKEKERKQPRMALIVDIARKMQNKLSHIVVAARKVLVRERRLIAAGKVEETDIACLNWYIRQPGQTMAQKAGANGQRLLGVARKENFDTLENKVLKDFLLRCKREVFRYTLTEVGEDEALQKSSRAVDVKKFGRLSSELVRVPHLEEVGSAGHGIRPNYVLQNDSRYREIWKHYLRLLRQEDEQDRLWDWQARTWADVARILVCATTFMMTDLKQCSASSIVISEILSSKIHISKEQHLGCRISAGSEPGPFTIYHSKSSSKNIYVLEIVHPSEASLHPATASLGRMGGHLYLVLTPINGGNRKVLVMWALHAAGAVHQHNSKFFYDWANIVQSASRALMRHSTILQERTKDKFDLGAFIVASDLKADGAELLDSDFGGVPLLRVAADQRSWDDTLAGISAILEQLLEKLL